MVEGSRSELRRLDQAQTTHYKRSLTFIIFTIITLTFSLFTFMNPGFMKNQIAKESNSVVAERFVNQRFDNFAETIGAERQGNVSNLLTVTQTQPIADAMIDYTLGIHWFRAENASLAKQIRKVILTKIDDNSSTEAKSVQNKLKKYNQSGIYSVITGFELAQTTLAANVETLFLVINIVVIVMCLLAGYSILREMHDLLPTKRLIHLVTSAGMWTGGLLIVIFALFALVPLIFNVEGLILNIGYFLEIASGIFLELVIIGAGVFIISTIVWQLTSNE
ncbi:hypothetical protein [uncultured Lactobacillus sp.]|uniref:hypothetical protein n=1 Tax=uncultured Lactobacillus sp. TaxID=153152 RepID=UPI002625A292|nr:hypothetical protein [uncultured Lactobacillus sp.]